MESNQNKLKSILSKMNVDDSKVSSKRSKLDEKRMNARNKYKVQKSNRVSKKKRQQPPSIMNKIIRFFTSGDNKKEYQSGDDSLYDIQSRFHNQDQVKSIKRKLTSASNKSTKSTYVDDSLFNFKGKNYYKTALPKSPSKEESPLTLRQLSDKLLEYEKTISLLEKKVSDMSNEVTLMQQQHKQNNGFVDMSLIEEKRKINNLQSSDPMVDFDDNSNSNINDNLRKRNKHGNIMAFDKLSPIKRQNTFLGPERNSVLDASPKESGKGKANAITSSPTKTYKGNKLSNTNITRLLRNENNKSEDSYDWRQIEEDSISSSDIE